MNRKQKQLYTHFDDEIEEYPTFSFNWIDTLLIGGFLLFFTGILTQII